MNQYLHLKILGHGSFGKVILVQHKNNGNKYAIKKIINTFDVRDSYRNELKILKKIRSKFIVDIVDCFKNNQYLYIVMEYASCGDLFQFLENRKRKKNHLSDDLINKTIYQILNGIGVLHQNGIIHRDIKPSNVLVYPNYQLKLTDFGISRILYNNNKFAKTTIGTPYYMSPEMVNGRLYTYSVDYWAFGCIFYEIVTFKRPFEGRSIYNLTVKIRRGVTNYNSVPYKYKRVIQGLLTVNHLNRYGFDQVNLFLDPYIKNLKKIEESKLKLDPNKKDNDIPKLEDKLEDINIIIKEDNPTQNPKNCLKKKPKNKPKIIDRFKIKKQLYLPVRKKNRKNSYILSPNKIKSRVRDISRIKNVYNYPNSPYISEMKDRYRNPPNYRPKIKKPISQFPFLPPIKPL